MDLAIDLFAVISVLLIGADIWGLDVGVNLRVDQLFLAVLTVLLFCKNGLVLSKNFYLWAFLALSLISAVLAYSKFRGFLFFCSILYNVFFVYLCFYNYVRIYGIRKFIKLFRFTCYILFVIMMFQVVIKVIFDYSFPFLPDYGMYYGVYRFSIWFYEPSYLATYLTFWLTLSLIMLVEKDVSYVKDIVLCLAMMVFSTSTSGFAGIAFAFVLAYLVWLNKGVSVKKLLVLLIPVVLLVVVRLFAPGFFYLFIGRIFSGDLNGATGGRIEKWAETFNVFLQRPLFGVGPGCYGLYLGQGTDYVPSNVTLELMATLGIFGALAFYLITLSLIINCIKSYKKNRKENALLFAAALALIVFTVILQVNQGYLRLYHWMFFGLMDGGCAYAARKNLFNGRKDD